MRVVFAALFVISCGFGSFIYMKAESISVPMCIAINLSSIILTFFLFNPWKSNPLGNMTTEEAIQYLSSNGQLETEDFKVKRAFCVEEYNDEGLHYFLELPDGRVLFLEGEYLYDYQSLEEIEDEQEPRARTFPCTDFTIYRHRTQRDVLHVDCRGDVLELEFFALPFGEQKKWVGRFPSDGDLISDKSYDAIKSSLS